MQLSAHPTDDADAFAEITTWHRWRELIAQVDFIVVTRPGAAYATPPGARVRELDFDLTPVPVSSRSSKGLTVTKWPVKEVKRTDLALN